MKNITILQINDTHGYIEEHWEHFWAGVKKLQIKLIKAEKVGTKNSMIVFNMLTEMKNIILHSVNVLKSQRDFMEQNGK